jgi:hypothetical protein
MSEAQPTKPKWTRRKKVIAISAVILLLIIVPIFTHLFWEMHEAGKVFSAFNRALIAKDYQRAYSLTAPDLQSTVNYQAFIAVHDGISSRHGALTSYTREETEVKDDRDGWFANIHARLVFERGEQPFLFVLKRVDGHWRVYSYKEL